MGWLKRNIGVILWMLPLLLIVALIFYYNVGWFEGDMLEYVKGHCTPDGYTIADGEYLAAGEDEEGGFVIYRVTTEDGGSHFIRVHIVFRRTLTRVGTGFKIRGIREIDHFEVPEHP